MSFYAFFISSTQYFITSFSVAKKENNKNAAKSHLDS